MKPLRSHPEYVGLYQDVLARPDDDTPRKILADWLDDSGTATGRTHARFIRGQLEGRTATLPLAYVTADVYAFLPGPRTVWSESGVAALMTAVPDRRAVYRRGFLHEVICPLQDWYRLGPGLASRHPLARVTATDLRPQRIYRRHCYWRLSVSPRTDRSYRADADDLEAAVWARLRGYDPEYSNAYWKAYDTPEGAADAASAALLQWARSVPPDTESAGTAKRKVKG